MSLTQIQFPPPTPQGFTEWAWNHYRHHIAIIGAARQIKNVDLVLYQIWPISPRNLQGWLLQHQQQHSDMNQLYGVYGNDLSTLDFNDRKAVDAFFYLQWQEHVAVAKRCGLPI